MSFYYLSNPYNGSEEQRQNRAKCAGIVCARFIKNGVHLLSPIVHNHAMMKDCDEFSLEDRKTKILDFDFSLLSKSKGMVVLTIDGWRESYGVGKEIEYCKTNKIPIYYLNYQQVEDEKMLKDYFENFLNEKIS